MNWSDSFGQEKMPTQEDIALFIRNPLWKDLKQYIEQQYSVKPKIEYSRCSMQKGWNVKYKKSGKSICTLYPMPHNFIALVVVGQRELEEADIAIQTCGKSVRTLYKNTPFSLGGKWLMIEVKDEETLQDVIKLIGIRVRCGKGKLK